MLPHHCTLKTLLTTLGGTELLIPISQRSSFILKQFMEECTMENIKGQFLAGFGMTDITPQDSVPMTSYGEALAKRSVPSVN